MKINLDLIDIDNPDLRRDRPQEAINELAVSLQADGQIQPISVRKKTDGRWSLQAGKTRILAARSLGWTDIEAMEYTGRADALTVGLLENIKRRQMSPLEEADAVIRMHEVENLSIREIEEKTHHSNSWIRDRLAIANYPENFKKAVHERKISIAAAGQLMLISNIETRDYYLYLARINGATVNQCQAWYEIWRAQQQLTSPDGIIHPDAYPHPPSPPPASACFSCGDVVLNDNATVVRICVPCYHAVRQTLAQQIEEERQRPSTTDARNGKEE